MKWGVNVSYSTFTVLVNIHGDGSVLVHHGGVEMGQGLNTKVSYMYYLDSTKTINNTFLFIVVK